MAHRRANIDAQIADLQRRGIVTSVGSIAMPDLQPTAISEKQFQAEVQAFAKRHGWKTYHTRDSRKSDEGFPDLVMLRERQVVAELKVGKNKTSAAQDSWIEAYRSIGVETYVWYPSDWPQITEVLGDAKIQPSIVDSRRG